MTRRRRKSGSHRRGGVQYGKLIVYEFPKDKLVYGPFQIEALINQNTEISQQPADYLKRERRSK
jgi:uncharacterized membrane protein (UPF0182 family)